ncbi:hypothetical protein RC96_12505 [Pectobacterium carotovorum subsp. carotovorum]|nr:hypothetical protein RC96_12505 [Pectobacterium carotovorum subsp. carotovorum]
MHIAPQSTMPPKNRVNPRVLTTATIKIYATFQLNRKLNDSESGHHLHQSTLVKNEKLNGRLIQG